MNNGTAWLIIASVTVIGSVSMGLRQSLGLFMPPMTHDLGITVSDFTLAIAAQNLIWGFVQPISGAVAARWGFRPVLLAGALSYVAGLFVLSQAHGEAEVVLGAGALIGIALTCTSTAMSMSVTSQVVSAERRSLIFGIVSAAGSLGSLLTAPLGQYLAQGFGWRTGMIAFFAIACVMIPAAWLGGRVDTAAPPRQMREAASAGQALGMALRDPSFLVMSLAYFVCGMQLIFLSTHLPSYLALCGMDPMLAAEALGVIGGFNIAGSLFFGWAGGRWPKQALLGMIYISRSIVLGWYFMQPPTPESTLVFAAIMGFLWLGVGPLVAGSVAETFGLRWQAMIQGIAFMSHQLGSFLGAFGGGWVFDHRGSYDLAWHVGVGVGLAAGIVQVTFALLRPARRIA